jgi:hypothetical protein
VRVRRLDLSSGVVVVTRVPGGCLVERAAALGQAPIRLRGKADLDELIAELMTVREDLLEAPLAVERGVANA